MSAVVARSAAWIALVLLAVSAVAAHVVPTLRAAVADAALLCAPCDDAMAGQDVPPSLAAPAVLRAPRCGVA